MAGLVQQCETCGALLMCEACLRPIKGNARAVVLHGDGACHARHAPDCFTASWTPEGCALWFAAVMVVLLALAWLTQARPDVWQAIVRLLPH